MSAAMPRPADLHVLKELVEYLAVRRGAAVHQTERHHDLVGHVVVDAQIYFALVDGAVAAEQLGVRHVYADNGLRDKILLFDVLLQEQKVVGQICGDNSCMLTHLLQDKTERKGAAERVAVGVIMGEDVVVVMPAQKRGDRRKLFSHLLPPHPPLYRANGECG